MSYMHMMTMVASVAVLTLLFVLCYKKKSEEDYQMKKLPPGYSPNVWSIHPVTGKLVKRTTTGQTSK